jgi:hypothetical protein
MGQGYASARLRIGFVTVLVAALGMTLAVGSSGAGAAGSDRAVAAKKCKKAHKGAASAKKRKCAKKHVLAIPGPLVRATITWPAGEVDLHAFDASGNRSGINNPCSSNPCPMFEGIPNAVHSPDANNGGTETFTDNIFVQGGTTNREFAYLLCVYDATTVTFTGVNALGQSQTLPIVSGAGEEHALTLPGGPQVPGVPGSRCPT